MNRPSWKRLAFVVIFAIALFTIAGQANAGWGHHGCCGGVYGPFPSYVAWDAGCCGDSYGWGWYRPYRSWGCCGGWYGGWYAGYGCCRPSYSCCGYDTMTGCCGDTMYSGYVGAQGSMQPTPAVPTPAKKPVIEAPSAPTAIPEPGTAVPANPTPANPPAPGIDNTVPAVPNLGTPSTSVTPDNSGMLTIWVPYDAKVTINGMATKSTGSRRTFVSYDLKPGFSYKYDVKAEIVRDGKIVEDTKTVVLTAGGNSALAFGFNMAPAEGLAAK